MTVHDCFGVHPNHIDSLRNHIKSVFSICKIMYYL